MLAQQLYRINKLTFIDIQPDGATFLGLFSALIWFNINNASIWLASPPKARCITPYHSQKATSRPVIALPCAASVSLHIDQFVNILPDHTSNFSC